MRARGARWGKKLVWEHVVKFDNGIMIDLIKASILGQGFDLFMFEFISFKVVVSVCSLLKEIWVCSSYIRLGILDMVNFGEIEFRIGARVGNLRHEVRFGNGFGTLKWVEN